MLINTCACRWSRIHPGCLDRVLESSSPECSVCKTRINHKSPEKKLTLVEQVWKANFIAATVFTIGTVLLLCFGLFLTFDGILRETSVLDHAFGLLGFGVVIYAMVMLHVVFSDGWPSTCPCRPPGVGLIGDAMERGQRSALNLGPSA